MAAATPDPLVIAQSVYSDAVAAEATMETLSFAALGSSLGDPAPVTAPTNTAVNPAGWSTQAVPSSDASLTQTTVILEGDVTQTLVAPLASVQSTAGISSSSGTSSGLSSGAKVALGVGLGLGIPGAIALLAAFYVVYRRRQQKRDFEQRTRPLRQMSETA